MIRENAEEGNDDVFFFFYRISCWSRRLNVRKIMKITPGKIHINCYDNDDVAEDVPWSTKWLEIDG